LTKRPGGMCKASADLSIGVSFRERRLSGQVTADVRGGVARRWDCFRVCDKD